jgi:hypothetical protein
MGNRFAIAQNTRHGLQILKTVSAFLAGQKSAGTGWRAPRDSREHSGHCSMNPLATVNGRLGIVRRANDTSEATLAV